MDEFIFGFVQFSRLLVSTIMEARSFFACCREAVNIWFVTGLIVSCHLAVITPPFVIASLILIFFSDITSRLFVFHMI